MMKKLLLISTLIFPLLVTAQSTQPQATPAEERMDAFDKRQQLVNRSLLANLKFENIGPTVFSGRITDIEVNPDDPSKFYVAYASGGLWYTDNNGTTFEPIFDHEAVMTIGDIAVNWEAGIIWVGTGENNSSRSSYAGLGMYKSSDMGTTWEYAGLPESHHIGRIVLDPEDSNTLWVAVLGHLYSPNSERGVYKTTDGGTTWSRKLYINDDCGAVDLVMDPTNPDKLYAAMWERKRRAWNFTESGSGSGIYKSIDGGETWDLLSDEGSGFPSGDGVGRIGLDITVDEGQVVLGAILDNYFRREKEDEELVSELNKDALRQMNSEEFLALEEEEIQEFLDENNFPDKYDAATVKDMVADDEIAPVALVEYLEDANALLFETDVIGAEVYISVDEGKTWKKTHKEHIDGLYNTYGYYFGQIRFSPFNADILYIMGVPILKSEDGGETWASINGDNVHADHHALWVSSERPGHLIDGNDGGINISYDDGENWIKCNSPSVGQFYYIHADRAEPYKVYGGLQDNGIWGGPHTYEASTRWHSTGQYPYRSYLGGDGMQVQVDYRDNNTLYCGLQFGHYYRVNMTSGERNYITPRHDLGERPYRWNWQTPILLSRHQQDIVYMGSNHIHRSFDNGDHFEKISPDLTGGGIKGDVPYGTITTIHESPKRFGLLYAGTDDGHIHITKDMGANWELISEELPDNLWVSRVWASAHREGRVYCALNGYRWDDFNAYVFISNDYGKTWNSIAEGLPDEPVNVVKEDPHDENILYVGTDHGLYISIDMGKTYHAIGSDLPAVAVHDLELQPEQKHLLVGTHGRSIYLANIEPLHDLSGNQTENIIAFKPMPKTLRHSDRWGDRRASWTDYYEPELTIPFYSKTDGQCTWNVSYRDTVINSGKSDCSKGLNYLQYDLSISMNRADDYQGLLSEDDEEVEISEADNGLIYLKPGEYTLEITNESGTSGTTFEVK